MGTWKNLKVSSKSLSSGFISILRLLKNSDVLRRSLAAKIFHLTRPFSGSSECSVATKIAKDAIIPILNFCRCIFVGSESGRQGIFKHILADIRPGSLQSLKHYQGI